MTSNPVIVLYVTGENAREKLLELRGSSNAVEAQTGTIRGDYTKDQDCWILYAEKNLQKIFFMLLTFMMQGND